MRLVYCLYQLCFAYPLIIVATILTSLATCLGCFLGNPHFWGYYPGKWWSVFICRILLLPVKVVGRENIDRKTSYVFVVNHQSAVDIFLIYGFLNHNFKWMMKKSLRKIPFVGIACEKARHIFVDRSSPSRVKETIVNARSTLQHGISLVVFPEGSRTRNGHVGVFRKGAFLLADELQLPVVPITLNGPFDVLPRTKGVIFMHRHPMTLIIHRPIVPQGEGRTEIKQLSDLSREIIVSDLDLKYKD